MELKKKNTILLWVVAGLLVLNIITIGSIWIDKRNDFKQTRTDYRQKKQVQNRSDILIDALDMNPTQIDIYKASRKAHIEQIRELKQQINTMKQRLHNEMFKTNPDSVYILKTIDSIGVLNIMIEDINYKHFMEINETMNETQKIQFKEIMDDMVCHDSIKRKHSRERKGKRNN